MATAFTNNPDSSRSAAFSAQLQFVFSGASGLRRSSTRPARSGTLWSCFGVLLGVSHRATPALFPGLCSHCSGPSPSSTFLMQTVFAWLERWLAQRRTREIMGVLFILVMLSFQLIGPMMQRIREAPRPQVRPRDPDSHSGAGRSSPRPCRRCHRPGHLSLTIPDRLHFAALPGGFDRGRRLRPAHAAAAQFRGENLSEAAARRCSHATRSRPAGGMEPSRIFPAGGGRVRKRNPLSGAQRPHAAHADHADFHAAGLSHGRSDERAATFQWNFLARTPDLAFPSAAAPTRSSMLTNLVYNSFGGDAGGVQFFYAAPVSFRHIVLAKNLTHASILACQHRWRGSRSATFYGTPHLDVTIATCRTAVRRAHEFCRRQPALDLFARRNCDYSTFGRQNASQVTVLAAWACSW
jgi:ABC-2 type transport system permease protein